MRERVNKYHPKRRLNGFFLERENTTLTRHSFLKEVENHS